MSYEPWGTPQESNPSDAVTRLYGDEDGILPDLSTLREELNNLANNPSISTTGREDVLDLIRSLDSDEPGLPFKPEKPGPIMQALGGVGKALGYTGRTALSAINQAGLVGEEIGDGISGLLGKEESTLFDRDDTNPVNRLGLDGFLSGVKGDGPISFLGAVAGEEDGFDFGDIDTRIPVELPFVDTGIGNGFLPDSIPIPDLDTLTNLGGEIAVDPLTFVRGPAIAANGGAATAAASRASKFENAVAVRNSLRALDDVSEEVIEQAVKSVSEGGLTTLIRDAGKGVGGLTTDLLDDIGVQRGLTFAGTVIPKTEGVVSALGAIRTSAQTGKVSNRLVQAAHKGFSAADGLDASALKAFGKDIARKGYSPLEVIDATEVARYTAQSSRGMLDRSTRLAETRFARLGMADIVDDISEKRIRELAEGLDEVDANFVKNALEEGTPLSELRQRMSPAQLAIDDYVTYFEKTGAKIADLEADNLGNSLLDAYLLDETIAIESRLLGPSVHYGMVTLDEVSTRYIPGKVDSFTARQLVGDGVVSKGVLNRQTPTLRHFFEAIATVDKLGAGHAWGKDALADSFFKIGNVPQESLDMFGDAFKFTNRQNVGIATGAFDEIIQLTDAERILNEAISEGVFGNVERVGTFEKLIVNTVAEGRLALQTGDLAGAQARLAKIAEVGARQMEGLRGLIDDLRPTFKPENRGVKIRSVDRGVSGGANLRRAEALSDDALRAEVGRVLTNQWFNPALGRTSGPIGRARLLNPEDEVLLAVAIRRSPETVEDALFELGDWINDWTRAASQNFEQFDTHFTPEVAEVLKRVETVHQDSLAAIRVWGAAGEQAADGVFANVKRGQGITKAEATALAEQVQDMHIKAGIKPPWADSAGRRLADGRTATQHSVSADQGILGLSGGELDLVDSFFFGDSVGRWGSAMHDNAQFLGSLRKAHLENEAADKVLGVIAKTTRIFKPGALFGGGSITRNFKGQVRVNHLNNVRVSGRGGYREWGPLFDKARDALRDETDRLARRGTSKIWDDIPAEDLEMLQKIAYSELLTSGGAGNKLDRALDVQERALGRVGGRVTDAFAAGQNRIEQVYAAGAQAVTSGRVPDFDLGMLRNSPDGIQDATRREMESYMRGALAWSRMAKDGVDIDEALATVSRNHFDYWDLTNAGQIVDDLMPFFVFRARITRLSAEMAVRNPGLVVAIDRIRQAGQDRDPYGAGQAERYTFGAGIYSGTSWGIAVDDPIEEGLGTVSSFLNVNPLSGNSLADFGRREIIEPATPLVGTGLDAIFGTNTSFGDTRDDFWQPVQEMDGFTPRITEFLADTPLRHVLTASGNLRIVDGEPFMTRNGAQFLTDIMPVLGRMESLTYAQTLGDGEKPNQDKIDRKVLNAFFGWTGIPYQLTSPDQRQALVNALGNETYDYNRLVNALSDIRQAEGIPG